MRILIIHNQYASAGGEDAVVEAEKKLLAERGHKIAEFTRTNQELHGVKLLSLFLNMIWSRSSAKSLRILIESFKPDIVHIHNTFMLISPSVYYVCKKANLPVVQTLHNFRLVCPSALLFRDGQICEDCLGKLFARSAIIHGCWRNSRFGTASIVIMLMLHNLLKTWHNKVDLFIALSEFSKNKMIQGGLNAKAFCVKSNFIHDYHDHHDQATNTHNQEKNYAIFVGRLSVEKGLHTLLDAWVFVPQIPLKIIGAGPLSSSLIKTSYCRKQNRIIFLGTQSRQHALELIAGSSFLVLPSCCYENFPLVIIEAFSFGIPVIASRLGAMAEIITDGNTGLLFTPGSASDLAAKVEWAWSHSENMIEMGKSARNEYEEKYTAERNYQVIMEIYHETIVNQNKP